MILQVVVVVWLIVVASSATIVFAGHQPAEEEKDRAAAAASILHGSPPPPPFSSVQLHPDGTHKPEVLKNKEFESSVLEPPSINNNNKELVLNRTNLEPADPCKAAGYLGDIALTDEEFELLTRLNKENKRRYRKLPIRPNSNDKKLKPTHGQLKTRKSGDVKFRNNQTDDSLHRKNKASAGHQINTDNLARNAFKEVDQHFRFHANKTMQQMKRRHKNPSRIRHQKKDRKMEPRGSSINGTEIKRDGGKEEEKEGEDKKRSRRAATARVERLWDFGVIPYEIESNFSGAHKALFKQAMRHWENYTCVTFVERTQQDINYILFTERPCGCCSFVGKRGNGPQAISIGKNCDKFGIVVHELGHVIGFWHEHTRPDRDDHVQILFKHIMPGQEYNFNTLTPAEVNSLSEPYDFFSIMHYARNTFARSANLDTIAPLKNSLAATWPEIGQRVKLSPGDITQANKLYRCPKCGQTLQDSSGIFGYPWMDDNNSVERGPEICQWRISGTHGEKIVITITMLDIPDNTQCAVDYLEARDGHWIKSPSLGRVCGVHQLPITLTSTDSRAWIEYRRSGGGIYKGFSAKYEAVCGGEIMKDNGMLSSPNYPDNYKANKECVWKLSVPEGYSVALKFQSFEVENHDHCVYDYLEVRDGHDDNSPLIGKYCGLKTPNDIKSTGKFLRVKFVSDGSVQKAGFAATFIKEFDECATDIHGCHHLCVNTLGAFKCSCNIGYELHSDGKRCEDACGGYINDAINGTIHSPSFPDMYPSNKNCVWQIVAPSQYRITINFTHFDLEGNNHDCDYDSIEIRSGIETDTKLHGTFCGSGIPQPMTSEGNTLRVTFVTDNTVQKTGFSAHFFTDRDECAVENGGCQHICKNTVGSYQCSCHNGFSLHDNKHDCKESGCQHEITRPFGDVSSPSWPDYYPKQTDCVWQFTTTSGHRIKLTFIDFEIEAHSDCTYDRLLIFDGENAESKQIAKLCGSVIPSPIISSRNKIYMTFYSDASVQRKGFSATHSTVCGGDLVASSKASQLYSHAKYGDHNYENKEDCTWKIKAEEQGFRVRIRFLAFEVEEEVDCAYDRMEIYDFTKSNGEMFLGRFCGINKIPHEFISSEGQLIVKFITDDTIHKKGFSAAFVLAGPDATPVTAPKPGNHSSNSNTDNNKIKSKSHKKMSLSKPQINR